MNCSDSPIKPKDRLKAPLELEALITGPAPTDPRNKIRFEIVSLAHARRHVKNGGKYWTDIVQENDNGKTLTYFTSPDKAIKEREKTNANGRIWSECPETKDVAYIVDKKKS